MASGVGSVYFSASVGWVRLGGLGNVGRGLCSSTPVSVKLRVGAPGLICGFLGFCGLGAFDGFDVWFFAVSRGGCSSVCALASGGSWFMRLLLGAARRLIPCRCSAGQRALSGSLQGAMLGVVVWPGRVSGGSSGWLERCCWPVGCLRRGEA